MRDKIQQSISATIATLLLGPGAAWAAGPPPDPTPSDSNLNTAGGTAVLTNNAGKDNTAR